MANRDLDIKLIDILSGILPDDDSEDPNRSAPETQEENRHNLGKHDREKTT